MGYQRIYRFEVVCHIFLHISFYRSNPKTTKAWKCVPYEIKMQRTFFFLHCTSQSPSMEIFSNYISQRESREGIRESPSRSNQTPSKGINLSNIWVKKTETIHSSVISHSSKSIWVIKLSFCQNDPPMGESFWQKDSLITHMLFELWLITLLWIVSVFLTQTLVCNCQYVVTDINLRITHSKGTWNR